jgi:hypothetical protein
MSLVIGGAIIFAENMWEVALLVVCIVVFLLWTKSDQEFRQHSFGVEAGTIVEKDQLESLRKVLEKLLKAWPQIHVHLYQYLISPYADLNNLPERILDVDDLGHSVWMLKEANADKRIIKIKEYRSLSRISLFLLKFLSQYFNCFSKLFLRRSLVEIENAQHNLFVGLPHIEVIHYTVEIGSDYRIFCSAFLEFEVIIYVSL